MEQLIKKDIQTLQNDMAKINSKSIDFVTREAQVALDKLSWILVSTINELEEALNG